MADQVAETLAWAALALRALERALEWDGEQPLVDREYVLRNVRAIRRACEPGTNPRLAARLVSQGPPQCCDGEPDGSAGP